MLRFGIANFCVGLLAICPGLSRGEQTNVLKYQKPEYLTASIYSLDRKKLLFNFTRRANVLGSKLDVRREYKYANGTLAALEKVTYEGNDLAYYELDQLQIGAKEVARIYPDAEHPGKKLITYEYTRDTESRSKPKTRTEPLRPDSLISDMLAPFLTDHWDALLRGEDIKYRYIVPQRRETIGFEFHKESETVRDGRKVLIVKMPPSSLLISALVDPLIFTIEKEGQRRILDYAGRTVLKVNDGGKWKDLDAVTVFNWK